MKSEWGDSFKLVKNAMTHAYPDANHTRLFVPGERRETRVSFAYLTTDVLKKVAEGLSAKPIVDFDLKEPRMRHIPKGWNNGDKGVLFKDPDTARRYGINPETGLPLTKNQQELGE